MSFNNAHHFGIGTATFNATTNITNVLSRTIDPVDILHRARAVEATHTSNTAAYAPRCKPGTRTQVIEDMMDWVRGGSGEDATPTSILWFSGPAGGGKTCVMRDVVDRCQKAGIITAAYFFSTRVATLDNERPFVATIAHQLVNASDPAVKASILRAILENPTIFHESLDLQMDKLVAEPLISRSPVPGEISPLKVVIAVDGFDECRDPAERRHLLRLLHSLTSRLPHTVFVTLASRPELDIRTMFDSQTFRPITHVLRLQDYDGTADIRHFLCDEFSRIRDEHPAKHSLPPEWPTERILAILIDKSSGNFIYPSTVIKYVDNPRRNPLVLLQHVVAFAGPAESTPENPFAELDSLYTLVLHPPDTDLNLMKRLLHCIIGLVTVDAGNWSRVDSPSFLDELLLLESGTADITLCDLHSVLSIPTSNSNDRYIHFHHKSLKDYLRSPKRSLELYQSSRETHMDLAAVYSRHLQKWASTTTRFNGTASSYPRSTASERICTYARNHWVDHLSYALKRSSGPPHFPSSILEFDPRIIWRFSFVSNYGYQSVREVREAFHSALCVGGPCLQLCNLLLRMVDCYAVVKRFSAQHQTKEQSESLLGQFDTETGLYDIDVTPVTTSSSSSSGPISASRTPSSRNGRPSMRKWLGLGKAGKNLDSRV